MLRDYHHDQLDALHHPPYQAKERVESKEGEGEGGDVCLGKGLRLTIPMRLVRSLYQLTI